MPIDEPPRSGLQKLAFRAVATCIALVSLGLASAPAAAREVGWTVYAGRWGLEKVGTATELGVEIQRPLKYAGFEAMGGLAATDEEAVWAYAGVSYSWRSTGGWRLRPGFAISLFENGDGKDLGGPIEFRSSLEASYRVRPKLSVGLLVYHLSNAGIYDLNPGSNSLVLTVGSP